VIFGHRRKRTGFGEHKNFALRYGNFLQRIALPLGVDALHLSAQFHHGVLEVHIALVP
jgi:HSP20 family molecular chaperone IbpA